MELKPKATESKASRYEEEIGSHLTTMLEPGEILKGFCTASQQNSMFSSGVVSLGTTDRRLIIQTLDRKGKVKAGEFISYKPSDITSVKVDGAGGGWGNPSAMVMNSSTIKLKIKSSDGKKLKFVVMSGSGLLSVFGGGETQRLGAEALMGFLGEARSSI